MDMQKFKAAYSESRNGANKMFRHPLVRKFIYSDGVQECADAALEAVDGRIGEGAAA